MKQIRLLAFVMLCLFGFSVNAQDFEPRVAPESPNPVIDEEALAQIDKTPQEFVVGEYYVIYNVGTQMYFSQGNNWGTRASIDAKHPLVVQFTLPSGKYLEDNALVLNDYCMYNKAWKNAFFDSETAIFVDRASQGNYFWQVVPAGDKTYRLQASPLNPTLPPKAYPDRFVGRDDALPQDLSNNSGSRAINQEALPLSPFLEAGKEGYHVDWQFFAAPGWKEYAAQKVLFDKSEDLRIAIEKGMDAGVDDNILANAINVYSNLESTVEEMDAQILSIMKALNGGIGEGASAYNPVDVTELIVNPDYDNYNEGWRGDVPAIGYDFMNAEFFNKNYNYYQPLQGIRNGVYAVQVTGYYRVGSTQNSFKEFPLKTNLNAKVFAQTAAGEVQFPIVNIYAGATNYDFWGYGVVTLDDELYVPNSMTSAGAYFDENAEKYNNTLYFAVTDGTANIGLKKEVTLDTDWTMFDRWRLTYYGDEYEAYKLMFNNTKEAYQMPDDGYVITRSYLQSFNEFAPVNYDASSVTVALPQLASIYDEIVINASLWVELDKVKEAAGAVAANVQLDPAYTAPLGEWTLEVDVLKRQAALSNQELRQLIALKTAEVEEAQKHPRTDSGEVDMTSMLQNPAFDTNDWTGWTKTAASGGNVAVANNCAEAWNNADFDIYQVVKNAPVGVYRISVQGFYRYGRGDDAYRYYQAQEVPEVKPNGAPVYVYLNEKTTPFKNVFDEPETIEFYEGLESYVYTANDGSENVFPDQMNSSARAFGAGMYTQDAIALVTEGQDLRIGVKGASNQLGDSWVIFDNFKLTFLGNDVSVVRPELESTLRQLEYLLNSPMSKSAYELLSSSIDSGYKAMNSEGENAGAVMMNALSQLFQAEAQAKVSINIFMNLESANQRLGNAISAYESFAPQDKLTAAVNLYNEIDNVLYKHSIEDEQANYYIEEIDRLIAELPGVWTMVGVSEIFGSFWEPEDTYNDMVYMPSMELFSLTKRNVVLEEGVRYSMKVVANHGWEYGSYPYDNYIIEVGETAVYDIIIYFNPYDKEIIADIYWVGEAEVPEKTWTIAGYADVLGSDWDATDTTNDMIDLGGYFELVKKGVYLYAYTEYGYKVVANHSWAENYGEGGEADGDNAYFYVEEEGYYNVYFYWNRETRELYVWTEYTGTTSQTGDVNVDGTVDVTDVVLITDYILERPLNYFNEIVADINADGTIDVADVMGAINMVLSVVTHSRAASLNDYVGTLSMPDQVSFEAGGTTQVALSLNNLTPYSAFQMDVNVPVGVTLEKVAFSERATTTHVKSFNKVADGKYRIIGYSMQNAAFAGENGELIQLTLKSDGTSVASSVGIDKVVFVTTSGKRHELAPISTVGQTTSVTDVKTKNASDAKVYDIQGRRVENMKKNLYIIDGKKVRK